MELSLSQAESKYDEYVEMCRNLRDENQHLKDDFAARSKEQEDKIIEIRRGANHDCLKGWLEIVEDRLDLLIFVMRYPFDGWERGAQPRML